MFQTEGTENVNGSKSQISLEYLHNSRDEGQAGSRKEERGGTKNLHKKPKIIPSAVMFTLQLHLEKGKRMFSGTGKLLK